MLLDDRSAVQLTPPNKSATIDIPRVTLNIGGSVPEVGGD